MWNQFYFWNFKLIFPPTYFSEKNTHPTTTDSESSTSSTTSSSNRIIGSNQLPVIGGNVLPPPPIFGQFHPNFSNNRFRVSDFVF